MDLLSLTQPFSTQEIHKLHCTEENSLNLAKKTAKWREISLLRRINFEQLPSQGKELVNRLHEIKKKKQIYRQKRNENLSRINKWKKFEYITGIAGAIIIIVLPIFGIFFPQFSIVSFSKEGLIPGVALLSQAAYSHYSTEKHKTETSVEYHDKKHGLDNERIAILVELEAIT